MSGEAQPKEILPANAPAALRLFYSYWLGKCPPGGLPGRQHIDPQEMKTFLPHIMLMDVVRGDGDTLRFRYRLIGTQASSVHGEDPTGRFVDEFVPAETYGPVAERLGKVVREGRPIYGADRLPWKHLDYRRYEHLDLPLASDGRTVDMIFCWRRGFE